MAPRVQTGLDTLVQEGFARLKGRRVGLLAHQPSVDAELRHALPLMHAAGVNLVALFGPEHGFGGAAQDMEPVLGEAPVEPRTGARIHSLYGDSEASLRPTAPMFEGLDVLVVDLQDVGARYYTYAATMGYCLELAAETGLEVLVLDRPNPLGGRDEDVEGANIEPGYFSFVGAYDMAIRHGFTLGEYARWVIDRKKLDVDAHVVPLRGWRRDMTFEDTGLPWVLPSPNMPTVDTAWIYPGQCLLEGTNLSEGRGTCRPFELCGAPYLDGERWAALAAPRVGPGFVLRPTVIRPTVRDWAGQDCGAIQIHVTDRWAARSLRLTTALLVAAQALAPDAFGWRTEAYEFVTDRLAIDLLYGSARPREMIEAGGTADDVMASFAEAEEVFREVRRGALLY
ncbi:MAG: DUF1343 domain-containing protein [Myxococcales bacterium]|nr:DUF1343 domain-containing protein [Myxococcales bacterium]